MARLAPRGSLRGAIALAALAAWCEGCVPAPPSPCGSGLAFCPESAGPASPFCVDLRSDWRNCGGCGATCPFGASCLGGRCTCPPGQDVCPGVLLQGQCVALSSDEANCGECGFHCGAGACAAGGCVCDASPGVVACPGSPACANTSSDPWNCGACGAACPLVGEACVGGTCECPAERPDVCPWGARSACVSVQTDPHHCGSCSTACPANGVCDGGTCACPSGTALCAAQNVCADLASDTGNCGACGSHCGGLCVNGTCEPAPPPPPESCGFIGQPCCPGLFCYAGSCNGLDCW